MPSESHLRDVNELLGQLRRMREERDAALTERAQARTELAAIKERTCETCKWKFVWLAHNNAPGCYRHGLALPPDCLGCAAHERRAQSAEDEVEETNR